MAGEAPFVEVSDVRMEFTPGPNSVVALDGISLEVLPQEFISLLGPSGCGKSTLLLLIAGLLMPTGGRLAIGAQELTGPFIEAGIVFQQDNLLEWRTIIDNVMLPVEIRRLDRREHLKHAFDLLRTVGLEGFEKSFPHQLSGGMRQRAALCRALVCDVPLLLMDEPFGALDALSREEHQQLLQRIWLQERKTVIFVTHDIREAVMLSDRIVVMTPRPGRIAELVTVKLPRPRNPEMMETPEFNALVGRIRRQLFDGGKASSDVGGLEPGVT